MLKRPHTDELETVDAELLSAAAARVLIKLALAHMQFEPQRKDDARPTQAGGRGPDARHYRRRADDEN